MGRRSLVFAHADGDGHLAAEQSRRNLLERGDDVTVFVHPLCTRNWRFWEQHFQEADFGDAETVYVVDIMLNAKQPLESYEAIVKRVEREPDRRFVVIDHHPVLGLPDPPKNLDLEFVGSVFECCVGEPSDLMVIASICDPDEEPVKSRISDEHRLRARGLKRAVSERGVLAGEPLLYLLRKEFWAVFEELAREPADFHRTMYGNRVDKTPSSPLLQMAYAIAGVQ